MFHPSLAQTLKGLDVQKKVYTKLQIGQILFNIQFCSLGNWQGQGQSNFNVIKVKVKLRDRRFQPFYASYTITSSWRPVLPQW